MATFAPNPFVSFREPTEEEEQEENTDTLEMQLQEDDLVVIHKQVVFEEKQCFGEIVLSDGTARRANCYRPGANGFIECAFEDNIIFETEILNKHISSDMKSIMRPLPQPAHKPLKAKIGKGKKGKG